MSLEADIYAKIWDYLRGYKTTTLSYIRGWFKSNVVNIPSAKIPSLCLYPISAGIETLSGEGDWFLMSLILRGSLQHFDIMQSSGGTTGRKGILDLYSDIDRVLFTMKNYKTVTFSDYNITSLIRTSQIFTGELSVKDVRVGNGRFTTETMTDDYPNIDVIVPIDVLYAKTDTDRVIT